MAAEEKRGGVCGGVFIPCTREIEIGGDVVYRPIRSWSSGTFAGEGLFVHEGDYSGCLFMVDERIVSDPPRTVMYRIYWKRSDPVDTVSAFLSYPRGMGSSETYFWEIRRVWRGGSPQRFDSEEAMEAAVREELK